MCECMKRSVRQWYLVLKRKQKTGTLTCYMLAFCRFKGATMLLCSTLLSQQREQIRNLMLERRQATQRPKPGRRSAVKLMIILHPGVQKYLYFLGRLSRETLTTMLEFSGGTFKQKMHSALAGLSSLLRHSSFCCRQP